MDCMDATEVTVGSAGIDAIGPIDDMDGIARTEGAGMASRSPPSRTPPERLEAVPDAGRVP
jgi:hypothetical protein